jgi:hypothetical protein
VSCEFWYTASEKAPMPAAIFGRISAQSTCSPNPRSGNEILAMNQGYLAPLSDARPDEPTTTGDGLLTVSFDEHLPGLETAH